MAEVGSAFVSILPSTKGFGTKLDSQIGGDLDKSGSKMGKRLGSAMKVGALGALAGLAVAGTFLKGAVGQASDLGETVAKTTVIFGDASDAVLDFANQGAAKLGQTRQEVLDAAGTFGTFGKAAGLQGPKLAKFSTGLSSLSTDLSSFFNTDTKSASEAIGAALRGESEPIRAYGVMLDDATLKAEALRLGLLKPVKDQSKILGYQTAVTIAQNDYNQAVEKTGKGSLTSLKAQAKLGNAQTTLQKATEGSIPALTQQQKVLAAQSSIMKQTKDAQGDFQRTSGGLANQQRILSASFSDLKTTIGGFFLPVVTKVVHYINAKWMPTISGFVNGIKDGTGAGGRFADKVRALGDAAGKAVGVIKGAVVTVAGFVGRMWKAFSAGGKTVDALKASFGTVRNALSDALGGSSGSSAISAGLARFKAFGKVIVANLVPAAKKAGTVFRNDILPAVTTVANALITNFVPVLKAASNTFRTVLLPALVGLAGYLVSNFLPIFKQVWGIISTQVLPIVASLAKYFYGVLYPAVLKIAIAVGKNLKPVFDAIFTAIKTQVLPAVSKLLAKFKEWLPTIKMVIGVVVKVVGWILVLAAKILGKVLPVVIKFGTWLLVHLVGALSTVIGWVIKIIGWVVKFGVKVFEAGKKVAEFIGGLKEKFKKAVDFVAGLPGRMLDALGDLGGTLKDAGMNLIQGLLDGITDKFDDLKGLLGNVTDLIPEWKGPPSRDAILLQPAGQSIMGGLIGGIDQKRKDLRASLRDVTTDIASVAANMKVDGRSGAATVGPGAAARGGVQIHVENMAPHDYRAFMGDMQRRTQRASIGGFA